MDIDALRNAYAADAAVAAICDELASRQRKQQKTKLRRMLHLLEASTDHPPKKHQLIAAFRTREGLGAGQYVEGRHGHPSRFEWSVNTLEACRAARGEVVDAQEMHAVHPDDTDDETDESILDHYFNLRADYQLELQLPINLSQEEAERLATFVRSLPLEDYQQLDQQPFHVHCIRFDAQAAAEQAVN